MSRKAACAASLIAAAVALSMTGCGGQSANGTPATTTISSASHAPRTARTTAAATGRTACELITPAVIQAAHFPDRVVRQSKNTDAGKNGASGCTYGDDPNPADISPSFLSLLILSPAALAAQHTTAIAQVKATAYPCTSAELRTFGPDDGFDVRAYFCASSKHSPDGGWVRGGDAYLLEVGFPDVDYGTAAERTAEFESVARAIAKNVGR